MWWRFWLIALASLATVAATMALGFWQLSRATQKQDLHAAMLAAANAPPLSAEHLVAAGGSGDWLHRRTTLRGKWLAGQTIFLDNRQMRGLPGLYVLTPFALAESKQVVMVQRGWVQRNFQDRSLVPSIPTPEAELSLDARVAAPPAKLYEFAGNETDAIRQNLDLPAYAQDTKIALLTTLSVVQIGAATDGLLRDWPQPASGVAKHYGYAVQWFALAALVASLFAWFQLIGPMRARKPQHPNV